MDTAPKTGDPDVFKMISSVPDYDKQDPLEMQTTASTASLHNKEAESSLEGNSTEVTLEELATNIHFQHDSYAIAFFDLETAGFRLSDDILQIAVKCGDLIFKEYCTPTQPIPEKASKVHGLTNEEHELFFQGAQVSSQPVTTILTELLTFLKELRKPVILIAHNCDFDSSRLLYNIEKANLMEEFQNVLHGFSDTLQPLRKLFPKQNCSLSHLASKTFSVNANEAHDAFYDVILLENVVSKFLDINQLVDGCKTLSGILSFKRNLNSLSPLKNLIGDAVVKKLASNGVNYENLRDEYSKGRDFAIELLSKKVDGKKIVSKESIVNLILEHLEK